MRTLAAACGWNWPRESDPLGVLSGLAELSADWDFRQNRERNYIEAAPAVINGEQIPDTLVISAARALGLVESTSPPLGREFSHLVVLSGHLRACLSRAAYAAELLSSGVRAGTVVALGAHRELGGDEPEQAIEAGLGPVRDEAQVILAAVRRAFVLGEPLSVEENPPSPDPRWPEVFHGASARYRWSSVDVVIAPSEQPENRRAKTGDQLRYWAGQTHLGREHDVLLVTTQIYAPYQHLVASRVLGLENGCGVHTCGVAKGSHARLAREFSGREYLQEIRAALRAGVLLLREALDGPR